MNRLAEQLAKEEQTKILYEAFLNCKKSDNTMIEYHFADEKEDAQWQVKDQR